MQKAGLGPADCVAPMAREAISVNPVVSTQNVRESEYPARIVFFCCCFIQTQAAKYDILLHIVPHCFAPAQAKLLF